jgi:CheY-like chemotaxis protein
MKEALSPEGAQVILTPEGHEAMDIFEERVARGEKVDFVVADLTIPGGMGGMEAVRLLREAGFSFKAIVVSGYSNDPVIADFKSYGFDGYLVKPFGMDLLIKTLKSLV